VNLRKGGSSDVFFVSAFSDSEFLPKYDGAEINLFLAGSSTVFSYLISMGKKFSTGPPY
jgi:hypothetical protein